MARCEALPIDVAWVRRSRSDGLNELLGLPKTLGRYELVGLLGQGGMGRVVRGHDPVLRRDVALKLIEPGSVDAESLDELRFMFHREARATASLRHPSIVEVFDYSGPNAEILYLACELIEGPTLFTHCEEHGALAPEVVAAIGYEVVAALVHAHSLGIVHRDLKPENIFWTREGRIVVSDFGIAKALDGPGRLGNTIQFGATTLYGSPSYIAPEQLNGEASAASDLYSVGTLLFELGTGEQAFGGEDIQQILDRVERGERAPYPRGHRLPRSLLELIDSLLQTEPTARPRGTEVMRALRSILDELSVSDPRLLLVDFAKNVPQRPAFKSLADARPERETWPKHELRPQESDVATALITTDEPRTVLIEHTPAPTPPAPSKKFSPVIASIVAVAVTGLASAFLLLTREPPPATVIEVASPTISTVPIRLRFETAATLRVDDGAAQIIERETTVWLTPGKHRVSIERHGVSTEHDILVLPGTTPVFDL